MKRTYSRQEASDVALLQGFRPVRDKDAAASKFQSVVARVCSLATFRTTCNMKVNSLLLHRTILSALHHISFVGRLVLL